MTLALTEDAGIARGARARCVVHDLGAGVRRSGEAGVEEAVGLSAAISLDIVGAEVVRVRSPRPATLFGTGQVEVLAATVAGHEAELVVVAGNVSPIQQRNLEKALGAKLIDRTGLILERFGERAATRTGTPQMELAHLDYPASRLGRSRTHLTPH